MDRPFTDADDGKRFRVIRAESFFHQRVGELEYPLADPGDAQPGEGVLWFTLGGTTRQRWTYVAPKDVEPVA